jgi:DNA processing protein
MVTAKLAANLGRDVGAVPGPVNSRISAGPNELLAGGARLVREARDVLAVMPGQGSDASDANARSSGQQGVMNAIEMP